MLKDDIFLGLFNLAKQELAKLFAMQNLYFIIAYNYA